MRIPAKFDPDKTLIYLTSQILVNGIGRRIRFLIDTGSSVTTISQGDAKNLGIDTSKLKKRGRSSMTFAGHVKPL